MRCIAFGGHKGGVGKTSITLAVADDMAHRHGLRVLVIDMDPQANSSTWLGVDSPQYTISDVLYSSHHDGILGNAIVQTEWEGVDLVPSEQQLASREADQVPSKERRLRRAIRTADLNAYDVIVIDCPPSLGPLFLMALNAADELVILTDSERGGVDGVARAIQTAAVIAEDVHPDLRVAGIVMNRFEYAAGEHKARWEELAALYPDHPRWQIRKRISVATAFGASVPPRRIKGAESFVFAVRDVVDVLLKEGQ